SANGYEDSLLIQLAQVDGPPAQTAERPRIDEEASKLLEQAAGKKKAADEVAAQGDLRNARKNYEAILRDLASIPDAKLSDIERAERAKLASEVSSKLSIVKMDQAAADKKEADALFRKGDLAAAKAGYETVSRDLSSIPDTTLTDAQTEAKKKLAGE